jgi:TolB-like protein/DNA-binding winged helix-turn-helix (wHTH) protein/Tfp pilus assembly protein PilF
MPDMTVEPPPKLRFGPFEADLHAGELRKHGLRVRLAGQPLEILSVLMERPGEVVTREELRQRLWPADTFVDFDHGLNAAVNKLREALGDSAEEPRYVETLPRRGYRFIGTLEAPSALVPSGPALHPPRGLHRNRRFFVLVGAAVIAAMIPLALSRSAPWRRPSKGSLARGIRTIAVLPFENLSRDPEQDYFAEGMTESLIFRLSQAGALHVISRTSVMQYEQTRKSIPEIARELKVEGIIEGAVQRSGDRVRISAKLIHASTDRSLWAASYERDLSDLLALESDVASAIAHEIQVQTTPEEWDRLAQARAVDREAYQLYLKGRYYQNRWVPGASQKAVQFFHEAIRKQPNYALAHAALAEAEVFGYPPTEAMQRAKAAALRAVQLDPKLPEAHGTLGLVRTFWDWDWKGAEASFLRALELNPRSAETHHRYSHLLAATGRLREAISECRAALELDPLSSNIGHYLGRLYYFARQDDLAIAQLKRTLELDPGGFWANFFLAVVYEQKGSFDEAVNYWLRAANSAGAPAEVLVALRKIYRETGHEGFRRRMLAWEETVTPNPLSSSSLALGFARLGETARALFWLERAFDAHTRDLIYMKVEPAYDVLRGNPRFTALLRRMALED